MSFERNSDGLWVNYGRKPETYGGSVDTNGALNVLEVEIEFGKALPLDADGFVMVGGHPGGGALIPSGAFLKSATLIVTTAFAGTNAKVSIGTMKEDGTALDDDGIDADIAVTSIDAIGDTITCDGDQIGTKMAQDAYVGLEVETADFTAGKATLIIEYLIP